MSPAERARQAADSMISAFRVAATPDELDAVGGELARLVGEVASMLEVLKPLVAQIAAKRGGKS